MNFLAHTYLSGNDDDLKIGNFLGDFVKGRLNKLQDSPYSNGIIKGIALHREIDFFTDSHPIVRQSIDRLQPKYRKFSGIVVDMFYDNIFAQNFSDYSPLNLPEFSQQFYDLLIHRKNDIPEPMERMVNSMIKRNWFTSYATYEGIEWSLKGISQRLSFKSGIEYAVEDLRNDYELYEVEFKEFFPQIIEHCQKFINSNS